MGEFRIGRSRAQHSYPTSPRATTLPLARNSASGPDAGGAGGQVIGSAGAQIVWEDFEIGVPPSADVPITPSVTGIVHVTGVIVILASVSNLNVHLRVQLGGVNVDVPASEIISTGETPDQRVAIPFDVIIGSGENTPALDIGVTANIQIHLTPDDDITVVADSSTIHLQEVTLPTG